ILGPAGRGIFGFRPLTSYTERTSRNTSALSRPMRASAKWRVGELASRWHRTSIGVDSAVKGGHRPLPRIANSVGKSPRMLLPQTDAGTAGQESLRAFPWRTTMTQHRNLWLPLLLGCVVGVATGYALPRPRKGGDLLKAVAAVQRRAPRFLI